MNVRVNYSLGVSWAYTLNKGAASTLFLTTSRDVIREDDVSYLFMYVGARVGQDTNRIILMTLRCEGS